jgi:aminomethyltransferase
MSVNPLGPACGRSTSSPRDFVGRLRWRRFAQQQQVGLLLVDKGGVLRSHQHVHSDHGNGEITSGTFSPTLGASIALARLPMGVGLGACVRVDIRDKQLAARVVKPPFVRHGKILVE